MKHRLYYYLDGRLFEWVMGLGMVMLAIQIFIWPHTLQASAFRWAVKYTSQEAVGVLLFVAGWFRIWALIANGQSLVIGPWLRAIGALCGAVCWFQFGTALIVLSVQQNFPSPGIPFWYTFVLAELWVTYRAVLDVRTPERST